MRYSLKLVLIGLLMLAFYPALRALDFPPALHPWLAGGLGVVAGLGVGWRYRPQFIESVVRIGWDRPVAERTAEQQVEGRMAQATGAQNGGRGGALGAAAAFVGLMFLGGSFISNAMIFGTVLVAALLFYLAWHTWGLERAYQARRQTPGRVQEPQEQI
jgi:hypothetical protein